MDWRPFAIPPTGRIYYHGLDGLRAVAFLLVFLVHYSGLPWGWVGVEIFFVLSGFLITGILWDTRETRHALQNFYIRRTLRIFPLFYATLAVAGVVGWLIHAKPSLGWLAWAGYAGNMLPLHPSQPNSALWLATQGTAQSPVYPWLKVKVGHFWSLCVEEQFYLVWPALMLLLRTRRQVLAFCLLVILACPVARLLVQSELARWGMEPSFLYFFTPLRLDAFMYGAVLAMVRRGRYAVWLERAAKYVFGIGITVVLVLLAPTLWHVESYSSHVYPSWEYTWGIVVADLLSVCLLVMALDDRSSVHRVLKGKALRWLGRISYGAYVFHYLFVVEVIHLMVILPIKHKLVPTLALGLALTLGLAWLSFRYLETPFIRLKSRLGSNRGARRRLEEAVHS